MDFAETLKRLMELKGMSRYKLAKEIPCSQASVGNWLNGVEPTPLMRKRITDILGELPKETPATDDMAEVLQAFRERPEMKMLFDAGLKANPETVRETARFLEGLAGVGKTD